MSERSSRNKKWELTEEAWAKFLKWLDPDGDQAGQRYEDIRCRLITIFTCRGCTCPEDLSDETINRVIRRVQEIADTYVGDPALYFYGVANNVHLEYLRNRPRPRYMPNPEEPPRSEREYVCLEECMELLPLRDRDLVLQYYQKDKRAKIIHREQIRIQLEFPSINALRIYMSRIRGKLEECVVRCLKRDPEM